MKHSLNLIGLPAMVVMMVSLGGGDRESSLQHSACDRGVQLRDDSSHHNLGYDGLPRRALAANRQSFTVRLRCHPPIVLEEGEGLQDYLRRNIPPLTIAAPFAVCCSISISSLPLRLPDPKP
jgi:hypothetical protein